MSDITNLNIGTGLCNIGGALIGSGTKQGLVFGSIISAIGTGIKQSSQMTPGARKDRAITSAWDVANGALIGLGANNLSSKFNILSKLTLILGSASFLWKGFMSLDAKTPYMMISAPEDTQSKLSWD